LDESLGSVGRINVLIAGKHATVNHPTATISEEQTRGLAVWPHLSDGGEPALTVVVAGDLPAEVATASVPVTREKLGCRVRVVSILDLTVLGDPAVWPRGLVQPDLDRYFGQHAPVLVVTLGHPAAVWGLLGGRLRRPVEVIGWREPARPAPQTVLAHELGLDPAGLLRAAGRLVDRKRRAA
jgi:xylulose-5-phosphate/fructose-6-phosphate phosphoketolase